MDLGTQLPLHLILISNEAIKLIQIYRGVFHKISIFKQQGPSQILTLLLAVAYMVYQKQILKQQHDYIMVHILVNVIIMLGSLIYEKQYAQIVYHFTIIIQFSYYIRTLSNENIELSLVVVQYLCVSTNIYLCWRIYSQKDSDVVNSAIAFFLLLEGFLYNIGALKEESLKLSMTVGIIKLFLSSFIIRMNFELHQIKEKQELSKQKNE
ncbi:hypothetical protein pb186bvf_005462 [Paramecium bursaria]